MGDRKPTPNPQALQDWLQTSEARALIEIPIAPDRWETAMENRLRLAWSAGYAAGARRAGSP